MLGTNNIERSKQFYDQLLAVLGVPAAIENTNPEYVSFEMDIMWIYFGGGDPAGLLKKYGNRWKLMHLKDLRKGTPKDLTGLTAEENDVPLGTGELNIPEILKEAKKAGIKHYFIEDESPFSFSTFPALLNTSTAFFASSKLNSPFL